MDSTFLALIVLGIFSIVSGKICEVSSGNTNLITSLNKKLLRSVQDESEQPNPSVYLGLRLSSTHSLSLEQEYLTKLQTTLVPSLNSSLSELKPQPVTGLLALYALTLQAACIDPSTATLNDKKVLQHLKLQLHHEKQHIASFKRPLTNYYQYSLGVLSLCVNGVRLNPHVIHKLTEAEKHGAFLHKDSASVDTQAMAGLAFQCLKDSAKFYDALLNKHVQHTLEALEAELVKAQDEKGLIGNVFSTPLAIQALMAMNSVATQCSTVMETLEAEMSLGTFHNPMAISQLLPVLHQKTYLDISKMDCTGEDDSLVLEPRPPAGDLTLEKVMVRVVVESSEPRHVIYRGRVRVPEGSSLHDALKEMQRQKPQEFSYETVDSLWGPYLTTVAGVMTQHKDRTYWQLIKFPDTPLIEGIADYKIQHGDTFILRKSKW
ncbi:transcobalamin-2 [Polyodon spathula]|uniref:transcobalamin-2 n=1 Tax=Polyodon spathula TaxID=7913 RepID=UPI001B7F5850|nr:transcobalamin-2 [Polyodon spathula]XP_041079286.1 transcobalamin-2 [Polyodon spathula]